MTNCHFIQKFSLSKCILMLSILAYCPYGYLPTYLNVSSLDCINVGFYLAIFFFQSFHQFVLLPPITSDVHPACVAPSMSSSTASSSSSSSQSNPVNKDEVGSWQRGGGTWILENVRQWVSQFVRIDKTIYSTTLAGNIETASSL